MRGPFKTLATSIIVSATLFSGTVFSGEPVAFEVVVTKPKAGVSLDDLLVADKKMEKQFVVKQKGFKTREVAVSKNGEVFVIVHWDSLKDAEAAAAAFMTDPNAKIRNDMSDMILFRHYIKRD